MYRAGIFALLMIGFSAPLPAAAESPGWPMLDVHVSGSDVDAHDHRGDPWTGERSLYIWVEMYMIEAAGISVGLEGSLEVVDLTPLNGTTNTGTVTAPILTFPECWSYAPVAEVRVRDATGEGGTLCFGASPIDGRNCTLPCYYGEYWAHVYYGFSSAPDAPCVGWSGGSGCYYLDVEDTSWGKIRARYR